MQYFAIDQDELAQRVAQSGARMEAEALARKEQKRADRKAGRLPEGVCNGLRSCTIAQLKKAKKLCDGFIWDQLHAPPDEDCDEDTPFIVQVLLSIPCRNQRFRLEITRSSKKAEKVYVNGPYWYRYWRDGKIVFRKQIKKKAQQQLLPRKVRTVLKGYLATHDLAQMLEVARAKYRP